MSGEKPPIEVGDWIRWVWDTPLTEVEDVAIVKTKSQVERLGQLPNERIIEIRKADGRVWRRS